MDERSRESELLGDAYLAEALQAIDQGNFTFDGEPETQREQLLYEFMKAMIQPTIHLG